MSAPRIVLFDPYVGGHHADHLRWLGAAWRDRDLSGDLVIAASQALFERHSDLTALSRCEGRGGVRFLPLPDADAFESPMSLAESAVRHTRLLRYVIDEVTPERLFAMYLDHAQASFALLRRSPTRLSGLLFRPETHLPTPTSPRGRLRRFRKTVLLRATMSAPSVEALFTLDPTAVETLRTTAQCDCVYSVPDPAPVEDPEGAAIDVRRQNGLSPDRSLWVMPGALSTRKGVFALLRSLHRLPASSQSQLCVLLAGDAVDGEDAAIEEAVRKAKVCTEVQVVWDRRFLPAAELQATIAQADVVLAPYVGHVGSSGIVMRAAAAGRPVITQSDGLIGWQARTHRLGRAVDPLDADALASILASGPEAVAQSFDPSRATAFARAHTVDAYVDAILGPLGLLGTHSETADIGTDA